MFKNILIFVIGAATGVGATLAYQKNVEKKEETETPSKD
jgi:hypothetical protein